jgi:PAS domain S-box-containing protein
MQGVEARGRTWNAVTTGVALLAGGAALSLFGALVPFTSRTPTTLLGIVGAVQLVVAIGLWVFRKRVPERVLHAIIVAAILATGAIVAQRTTYAGITISAFPYVWIALYTAVFFRRRVALAYAGLIVVVYGAAVLISGLPHVATAWVVVSTTAIVGVFALSAISTQLRRQNTYLRAVMTSAAEGIITLTNDGRGSFVNPGAAAMLGYKPSELIGRRLSGLIVSHELHSGEVDVVGGEEFVRKDGSRFPVMFSTTPIRLENGESDGIVLSFVDISERREIERMKDEFISVVGHELRTPLTSIRGSLGLMAGGVFGELDEDGKRMLDIAVSNTDRLVRLINDVLDIERIESGRVQIQKVPCSARDLVDRAIEAMDGQASVAGVRLVADADDAELAADLDRIQQALTNLISNAIKFSAPGQEVQVTAQGHIGSVLFGVVDHGRGVPADKTEAIFERFGQVDASDSREKGGTGLGLPISRSIVEQHGGKMWVDSTPGQGSTFWFTLPRSSEAMRAGGEVDRGSTAALVVEDDADLASVLRTMLRRHGVEAVVAPTAERAIDVIDERPPLLLVLDIELIGSEGGMVVDHLRQHPDIPHIPVVVYTVHDLSEQDRQRLTLGKTLFFTKGRVTPEEFEQRVAALLEEVHSRTSP